MISMDELHNKLKRHLEEEKTDSDVYCELAKCAEAHGEDDLAFGLWMIAADEQSHKDFLENHMRKWED